MHLLSLLQPRYLMPRSIFAARLLRARLSAGRAQVLSAATPNQMQPSCQRPGGERPQGLRRTKDSAISRARKLTDEPSNPTQKRICSLVSPRFSTGSMVCRNHPAKSLPSQSSPCIQPFVLPPSSLLPSYACNCQLSTSASAATGGSSGIARRHTTSSQANAQFSGKRDCGRRKWGWRRRQALLRRIDFFFLFGHRVYNKRSQLLDGA